MPPRETKLASQAAKQHGLVTAAQLVEVGFSRTAIWKRVANGRLFRIHRGVFSLTPPPHSRRRLWHAAVLAYGPRALLCGISSAELCGYADTSSLIAHVAVPEGSGRSREGVCVHRHPIDPRDIRKKHGIPCTSADRVLIDLAPHRTEPELETLLVAAESLHLIKRGRLAELIDERRGRPGMARLASIIALEPAIVRSDLELIFLPIWREAGVSRPRVNFSIEVEGATLIVDFAWPELRMVVEADSQRFHGDWESAARDRERDQLLAVEGWICHRFTRGALVDDRPAAAARLRDLTDARIAEPTAASRLG